MIFLEEANSCCYQYYTTEGNSNHALHEEMFLLLASILRMGKDKHDTLKGGLHLYMLSLVTPDPMGIGAAVVSADWLALC
jgi:hypothetical protein